MYPGSLDTFYTKYPYLNDLSYKYHIALLLENTTEFIGSYNKNFRRSGLESECIIANDEKLQKKWADENDIKSQDPAVIILNQVKSFKPDILWIEDLNYTDAQWLNDIRQEVKSIKLIIAYHCSPFNKKVLDSIRGINFLVTCTPGLKTEIEKLGKKSFLVYHGFDRDLLMKITDEDQNYIEDFIFSGSLISGGNFHSNRIKLIESIIKENIRIGLYVNLEDNYRIHAKQLIYLTSRFLKKLKMEKVVENNRIFDYGKTWVDSYSGNLLKLKKQPLFGIDMYKLFKHSKVVLNYHIGVAGDYAGNMRMFEVTGVGSCLLSDRKKNMNELFDDGEVVLYENPADCISKIKWLLENESERRKIALAGQKKTLEVHTVEKRCSSIIDIINSELKN